MPELCHIAVVYTMGLSFNFLVVVAAAQVSEAKKMWQTGYFGGKPEKLVQEINSTKTAKLNDKFIEPMEVSICKPIFQKSSNINEQIIIFFHPKRSSVFFLPRPLSI